MRNTHLEVTAMAPLPSGFYDGDTVEIARRLLGKVIVREIQG